MKTVSEIKNLVTTFETRHQALVTRMDSDYNIWQLSPYKLDGWSDNVTYPEPRAFANSLMQTLGGSKLKLAFHRDDKNGKKEAKLERFVFSALAMADNRLNNRLMPKLQSCSIFYGAIRGFIAGRILVYKKDKGVIVDILPYDPHPKFLAYGASARGMEWTNYSTWRDSETIKFEYKKDFKAFKNTKGEKLSDIRLMEFWDDGDNVILVADEVANDGDSKHKLEHPPVIVVPIGDTPLIVGTSDKYAYVTNWGESIYAGVRDTYEQLNKILTISMNVARKSDRPGGFAFVPDDKMKVNMPWGTGEMTTLPMEAKIQMVNPPDVSSTLREIYQTFSQAAQRITYPYLRYGQTWKGQEWSEPALSKILQGSENVANPLLQGLSTFYKKLIYEMVEQYIYTGMKWDAVGRDSKGRFFQEEIKPGDLEGKFEVEVEFVSITPEEDANNWAKVKMMQETNLLSNKFLQEKVGQIQDYAGVQEEKRVDEAEILNVDDPAVPKIKILRTIEALKEQGKKDEATLMIADFIKRLQKEDLSDQVAVQQMIQALQQSGQEQPPQGQPQQGQSQGAPPTSEEEVARRLSSVAGGGNL